MARSLGKNKNWGSRSGRNQKNSVNADPLLETIRNLPSSVLAELTNCNASVQKIAAQILADRAALAHDKKPKLKLETKLGRLYQGDCISFLQAQEDESIDCIFADPPFNLRKDYKDSSSDDISDSEYLEWTRTWIELSADKLKNGGSFFIYNIPKWSFQIASFLNKKLDFKHWISVDITFSMPIPGRLYPSHYALLYFVKGGRPNVFAPPRTPIKTCVRCGQEQNDYGGYKSKMNPKGINIRDVWTDIPPVRHSKHKNRDANELSLKLLDRALDISTKEGDLVYDPFGGSGTTFVAAELKNRRWLGTELGDCSPILERFGDLDDEKNYLEKFRKNINTLFTDKALNLRIKNGLPIDNYRIEEEQLKRLAIDDKARKLPDLDL